MRDVFSNTYVKVILTIVSNFVPILSSYNHIAWTLRGCKWVCNAYVYGNIKYGLSSFQGTLVYPALIRFILLHSQLILLYKFKQSKHKKNRTERNKGTRENGQKKHTNSNFCPNLNSKLYFGVSNNLTLCVYLFPRKILPCAFISPVVNSNVLFTLNRTTQSSKTLLCVV